MYAWRAAETSFIKIITQAMLGIGAVLLVAFTLGAIWAWAPDQPWATLKAKYERAGDRYVDAAGTLVRVRDTGAEDKPAVVLLHGFASSLETWDGWAASLSDEYRVVQLDFPGSRLSAPDAAGDYTDARSLQILGALLQALGIMRPTLIGNSMGGRIAWLYAARHPGGVGRLVLISPDGFASPGFEYDRPPQVPAILKLMQYFLPKRVLRANLAAAYADPGRLTAQSVDRYYDLLRAPGARAALLARMRQTLLRDPRPVLAGIAAPTLLMWGKQDHLIPFSNAADYAHALPNATLVAFSELGHVPQEESPAESVAPLRQFLLAH